MKRIFSLIILFYFVVVNEGLTQDTTEAQLRFNVMIGTNIGNNLYLQADIEYRTLLAKNEYPWQAFDFTLFALYYPTRMLDLSFEIANGLTQQTTELKTYEATQRIGARWYIFQKGNNLFRLRAGVEGASQRLELSNFIRFEHRNFDYYGDMEAKEEWRIRNRTQFMIALNKKALIENRVFHFQTDFEFFTPNAPDVKERFASLYRVRAGFGYRQSFHWRYSLLYMYDKSRTNIDADYKTKSHMLNFQLLFMF